MNHKATILVAEDDPHIRTGLVDTLESEGYEVVEAATGEEALYRFHKALPDLILLDVMMPEKSGYDVCREVRRTDTEIPIIMLTAKGEELDKVVGLELGADDYVTKPFGVRELLARIAVQLRRSHKPENKAAAPDQFLISTTQIDAKRLEARRGEEVFRISARELKLLEAFYLHPGEVLDRNALLMDVWGVDYEGTTRTLDQHIAQLRKKIEPDPDNPAVITTVYGVGYRYGG